MGALEGMTDCQRHWGQYDEALWLVTEAFRVPELPEYPRTPEAREFAHRRVGIALKMARWRVELGETDVENLLDAARREKGMPEKDWLEASYLAGLAELQLLRHDFDLAIATAREAEGLALKYGDPVTLPQARLVLCSASLMREKPDLPEAARHIQGAGRYLRPSGPLIALGLQAVVSLALPESVSSGQDATSLFGELFDETSKRLRRDTEDITAWDFRGFAMCGLPREHSAGDALDAFRTAAGKAKPPAPNRADRLVRLLGWLDQYGGSPGRLQPVVQELSTLYAPPTGV
jgi:hypothetical protein